MCCRRASAVRARSDTTVRTTPPPPQQAAASNNLGLALFAAVAKETPWIAILGTGALALAQMYLGKRKK